jgi:hypothetical protein
VERAWCHDASSFGKVTDTQFISELMLVVLENKALGFDQDVLDDLYAKYDDPDEELEDFSMDEFRERYERTKATLLAMERQERVVTAWAKGVGAFYSLWTVIALHADGEIDAASLAGRYAGFMRQVDELAGQVDLEAFFLREGVTPTGYRLALRYLDNARGASTDLAQRQARVDALREAILQP